MRSKIYLIVVTILILMLALSACTSKDTSNLEDKLKEKDEQISALEEENQKLKDKISEFENKDSKDNILSTSLDVIELIRDKDMKGLSDYVHPSKGLRFSPYDYVDVKTDQVFSKEEVAALNENTKVYTWGYYDGSGEPIELDFSKYFNRFVYDVNFANPHMIGNNSIIGKGNTISNIEEVYPNGYFVEFYFSGLDSQYEGMDWRSLKLVFEQENGEWYLVGVIHSEWTI